MNELVRVIDRKRSVDPTHTAKLRRAFRAQGEMNLRKLRSSLRQAIVDFNILGLSGTDYSSLVAPAARIVQFTGWLETAAFAALDTKWWTYPYIYNAINLGSSKAFAELQRPASVPSPDSFDHLHQLAQNEVRGIISALVQKVTRTAHDAIQRRMPAHVAFRVMAQPLDQDIKNRLRSFTNTITVKSFNTAKLEIYRTNGISRIGIDPELRLLRHVDANLHIRDDVEDLVGVLTAGDDEVCVDCEDYADDAPYDIDEIELPLHPNCRCSVYPYDDQRFAHDSVES